MMISILTTNVFPGNEHLKLFIQCLGNQTCQDFEWIFLDGHYYKNRGLVSELSQQYSLKDVKHYPSCGATHIGRRFHWCWYNNSLLLAKNDLFLRMGVYRWFHSKAIELAVENYSKGIFVDFSHTTVPMDDFGTLSPQAIDEKFDPKFGNVRDIMTCSSGMFSCSRDVMLQMNGNDEVATTMVHHEDADLNSRWIHMDNLKSMTIDNAMFRLEHHKAPANIIPELEQKNSLCCGEEFCLMNYPNTFDLNHNPPTQDYKFEYRGFQWKYCPDCNAMSPLNSDEYLLNLRKGKNYVSSIGVKGIAGRDIRIVYDDLSRLNDIQDKLNLLRNSHDNKRYLNDTECESEVYNSRFSFSRKLKSICEEKKIKFIDQSYLYSKWKEEYNKQKIYKNKIDKKSFIINCINEDSNNFDSVFIFDLLQDYNKFEINKIFNLLFINKKEVYISMIHPGHEDYSGQRWETITWWDDYIAKSEYFCSDSGKSNEFRNLFDEEYKKYLSCFFVLKSRL